MTGIRVQGSGVRELQAGVRQRGAFTLIELLVVVAIIMILMGLLFPAYNMVRQTAKKTRAKYEVKQLDIAWKSVLSDYRTWALAGVSAGAGNMDNVRVPYLAGGNTTGTLYMEFDQGSLNDNGWFMDPWYSPRTAADKTDNTHAYRVCLGVGTVDPYGGNVISRDVAAWSKGRDGLEDAAHREDDVKSWE
jgi:prepilin-type N-terminal cleavage/methylation domain-containing protein